jgi:hypothetical protein
VYESVLFLYRLIEVLQYNSNMSNIYLAKGKTIADQYEDIGRVFAKNIQSSVAELARKRAYVSQIRRSVAEETWRNISTKIDCAEFVEAITGWSHGAGITIVEAMWLIADNLSGCQTLIARYGSGVALMHTEEEFIDGTNTELHMTTPHTVAFNIRGEVSMTLVYNNLLPGAGLYAWKKDLIVACDSLFLRQDKIDKVTNPLLANIVSWLVWRMKPEEVSADKIISLASSLGELVDGYAINIVRNVHGNVEGYKLIMARSDNRVEYLGKQIGCYLCQTNIVDPSCPSMKWTLPPKNMWRGGWRYFMGRIKMMDLHAKQYREQAGFSLHRGKEEQVHKVIQKEIFTKLKEFYLNPDVGAVCVGLVDDLETSVSCKLNNDQPLSNWEYLERMG